MGLDLSLEGLVLLQMPQLIFQVSRRQWLFQLLDPLLDPVLGLVGWGYGFRDADIASVHRDVPPIYP